MYKAYREQVKALRNEMIIMGEIKLKVTPDNYLYTMCKKIFNYWGYGYLLPLFEFNIEIAWFNENYEVTLDEK